MAKIHILNLQDKIQKPQDLQDLVIEETNLVIGGAFSSQGAAAVGAAGFAIGSLGGPVGAIVGGVVGAAIGGLLLARTLK